MISIPSARLHHPTASRPQPRLTPWLLCFLLILPFAACVPGADEPEGLDEIVEATAERTAELADSLAAMDEAGREYIGLVLELGTHDDGYVDAYYGPQEWRDEAEAEPREVAEIGERSTALAAELRALTVPGGEGAATGVMAATTGDGELSEAAMAELRRTFLARQLEAVAARAAILGGEEMSFDEEARALYDATPPTHSEGHFAAIVEELEEVIPGDGALFERYNRWRDGFVIPEDKLDAVFQAAIAACRERTAEHVELPNGEGFTVEYVKDKPWSGYNWYQGDAQSLIQVNSGLPIYIDRAIDLACHEGYPGHHAFNALLEQHMVRDRGWHEFSVYPLYSPQSLLAEGTANYGIQVAFPGDERVTFERDVLFPLAGLDPATADDYYAVLERVEGLSYAGNEAARRYLNGDIDAAGAADWLQRYALSSPERATQRVSFFDTYRSYVINYNLGQDMVRQWVEAQVAGQQEAAERAGREADEEALRWDIFTLLLTTPRTPSSIALPDGVRGGGH